MGGGGVIKRKNEVKVIKEICNMHKTELSDFSTPLLNTNDKNKNKRCINKWMDIITDRDEDRESPIKWINECRPLDRLFMNMYQNEINIDIWFSFVF